MPNLQTNKKREVIDCTYSCNGRFSLALSHPLRWLTCQLIKNVFGFLCFQRRCSECHRRARTVWPGYGTHGAAVKLAVYVELLSSSYKLMRSHWQSFHLSEDYSFAFPLLALPFLLPLFPLLLLLFLFLLPLLLLLFSASPLPSSSPSFSVFSFFPKWAESSGSQYTCATGFVPPPDNWLTSSVINVTEAEALFISINFTMKKCQNDKPLCRENVTLHAFQGTGQAETCPGGEKGGYKYLTTITAKRVWTDRENRTPNRGTWMLTPGPNASYVCVAFHDQGACVTLLSFVVSYKFCPSFTEPSSLIQLPRTAAPGNGAVKVLGSCPENAANRSSSDVYGYCGSSGEWNVSSRDGTCKCQQGFQFSNEICKG